MGVQLDTCHVAGIAQSVVHVARVLAAVSPPEPLDHQGPVVEDGEVTRQAETRNINNLTRNSIYCERK